MSLGRRLFGRGGEAIEFPEGAQWLNTDHPLTLDELKGRIVLLDFWTYCCINCMHVIPDLRRLEEKYPELVVVGVHSAKFENERDAANISAAILRYDIGHPVLVDNGFVLWHAYGVRAWPSFVLIDPVGNVAGQGSGEGAYDMFDATIASLSAAFGEQGLVRKDRMRFKLLKDTVPEDVLSFPGKVAADERGTRLFVSDSNHNSVLVMTPEGIVKETIGSGAQGRADGAFGEAALFRPQGLAYDPGPDALYIADTENHLVRRADLRARTVTTVLGTGEQGGRAPGGRGMAVAISSPWDLVVLGEHLYVAMAGTHTIWRMHLGTLDAERWAGSGAEDIIDGPRRQSALAQPSGIATDGQHIYFADSEVSAVRAVEGDRVRTIVGEGLFEFGDVDGQAPRARLQHPIGIVWRDGLLYVADTYNHRVKVVDPRARTSRSLIGTGERGRDDGPAASARLNEPNGLAFLGGRLYIADTNNGALRVYDPATGAVTTVAVRMPAPAPGPSARSHPGPRARTVRLPTVRVSPRARAVVLRLEPPEGHEWNREAPSSIAVEASPGGPVRVGPPEVDLDALEVRVPLEVAGAEGTTTVRARAFVFFCQTGEGLCRMDSVELELPLEVAPDGQDAPVAVHRFAPPG